MRGFELSVVRHVPVFSIRKFLKYCFCIFTFLVIGDLVIRNVWTVWHNNIPLACFSVYWNSAADQQNVWVQSRIEIIFTAETNLSYIALKSRRR